MDQIPLIDCHTHTDFSFDCDVPADLMCKSALQKGIGIYAITDHYEHCSDVDDPEEIGCQKKCWKSDVEAGLAMMRQIKECYAAKGLEVLCGIELGEPTQNISVANQIVQYPYDMVIGSLHNLTGRRDFYFLDYSIYSQQELMELMRSYFEELYRMARWGNFDTAAHLDYPFRYLRKRNREISFELLDEYAAEVLRYFAQTGKAIEYNTSRFEFWGDRNPALRYLKLFRNLGGEFVTIGSDSHTAEQIGFHLRDGYRQIADAGFDGITYFRQRNPMVLKF